MRIPALRQSGGQELVKELSGKKNVLFARHNPRCNALVVRYNGQEGTRNDLLQLITDRFPAPGGSRTCTGCDAGGRDAQCSCRSLPEASIGREVRRFGAITAVVGVVFLRSTILGATVSQTLFSPLGLATLAFSLPLARRGAKAVKRKRPNLDSFLAGGVLVSLAGGQAAAALEILWINTGADVLSAWIAERSRKHISDILEITSHHTFVVENGMEVEREVSSLFAGDVVALHTGEKISVDGFVIYGEAMVNDAPITGREELVHRTVGDKVFAGSFVQEGVIHVQAENVGDDTYLARVMHKVQESLETRAPIEGVADDLASRLVKLGFVATAAAFVFTGSLWRAYTVLLVMACPCATVLAASTAVSAAMNTAARNHILIKGGRYLEEAGKCKTVFFDKTGTLTTMEPQLVGAVGVNGVGADRLLQLAASTETHNHHPLAQAIMAEASLRNIQPLPHAECDYHLGMGVRALLGEDEVLVGNAKLAQMYGADADGLQQEVRNLQERGLTVLYVHKNQKLQGILGVAAQERPQAAATIRTLRKLGVERVYLITGDEEAGARQLAERLGADDYFASIMPEDKAVIISETGHGPTLMVGDGVNDALALTRADVGVAFGVGGSEVAVEAADIALVKDDLENLAAVYHLSKKTLNVARQNFWIATGSNIIGVILGFAGLLSPVSAGLVHIVHSLGVLANSSRLLQLPRLQLETAHETGEYNGFQHAGDATQISLNKTPCVGEGPNKIRSSAGF